MHHLFSFDEEFKGVPFGKNIDNKCSVATDADVLMWMHARSGALNNFNCKVVTVTIMLQQKCGKNLLSEVLFCATRFVTFGVELRATG